jgi:hypothetical protein
VKKFIVTGTKILKCSIHNHIEQVRLHYWPSGIEAALSGSSTYCTLVNITSNMSQAVLDAIIHNILQEHVHMKLITICY